MSFEKAEVYIMINRRKGVNGENNLRNVGEVFFNDKNHYGIASPCPVKSVEELNKKILTGISRRMHSYNEGDYHHYSYADINFHIIYEMRWRRCRGFLAIQKSELGTRYMVYLANYKYHSSASFGTSAEVVDYNQIKEYFIKEVKKIRDNWNQLKDSFGDLNDDDFNMDKFDERFGLTN
jgi:hypothetical protein